MKRIPVHLLFLWLVLLAPATVFALTSRDLIRLKKAGVPEDAITLMLKSGYANADEVISLEKAGFGEEAIKAFILSNRREKGEDVYSTKGLEDLQPPYQMNTGNWAPLPGIRLFVLPGGNGNPQGNTGK
ncbi:MAG: hypothetical protein M0Z61_16100 [Nitrospiraceae bacterium]|nr:hypothetical protein [Nitrospiraceae bacterium]